MFSAPASFLSPIHETADLKHAKGNRPADTALTQVQLLTTNSIAREDDFYLRNLRYFEAIEYVGHLNDSAEMPCPRDLSACVMPSEIEDRVSSKAEEPPLAQPDTIDFAAESDVQLPTAEKQRASAEIKILSKVATEQIDRMEQASTRLALLEQVRLHAEKMVYQRAEREIRLQAEIEALRRTEAAQLKRIEEAEAETRRLSEEETRSRATAEAWRIAEAEACQRAAEALELAEEGARRLAETEEQGIKRLETIRRKAEASSYERAEKERLLTAQLLAFGEAAGEQVKRIERTEADLREAEKKAIQFEEAVRQNSEDVAIRSAETEAHRREPVANDFPMVTCNAETAAAWDVSHVSDQADLYSEESAELVGNNEIASFFAEPLETYEQPSTEDFGRLDPVRSKEHLQPESAETSIVSSLVERIRNGGPAERTKALQEVSRLNDNEAFGLITSFFDDASAKVRNAAARALFDLGPNRADTFARALSEASPTRRRQIALALDGSGLAAEAIDNLAGESREKIDDAFSMLLLIAKAGEFKSLLQTIDTHPDDLVRLSVIKVLTFCNQPEIIPAFRSLAVRGTLPIEIRAALLASIYEISKNTRENSHSTA